MTYLSTGDAYDGVFGFYNAARCLLKISDRISDDQMHEEIVKYYFKRKEESEYGWSVDVQRQTLAILYDVIICVVCIGRNEARVNVEFYGNELSLGKKFIYILWDQRTFRYYPLSIETIGEATERITIFESLEDDLLRAYIRDELRYDEWIEFGALEWNNPKILVENERIDSTERILDSTLMATSINPEQSGIANIQLSSNNKRLPSSISHEDEGSNKRLKLTPDSTEADDIPVETSTNNVQINQQSDPSMIFNGENKECQKQCDDDESSIPKLSS